MKTQAPPLGLALEQLRLGGFWTHGDHNLVLICCYISAVRLLFFERFALQGEMAKKNKITNKRTIQKHVLCKHFSGWCLIGFNNCDHFI